MSALRRVEDVALDPLPFVPDALPRSHLVRNGRQGGPLLRGVVLEAAVDTPAGLLVFATDDVPFEEGLNLTLVSPSGEVLDEARIGGTYTTGVFRNLKLLEGARLRFAFLADPVYEVEVRATAGLGLPWWTGARHHAPVRDAPAPSLPERAFRKPWRFRLTLPRFTTPDETLTPDMQAAYARDGVLLLEDFAAPNELAALRARMEALVAGFDPASVSTIFSTDAQAHAADDYFKGSGDTVRFFFEAGAFDASGTLVKPKEAALNKVGHALHDLDPVFAPFSHSARLGRVAAGLGMREPRLMQSMYIFKHAHIGGEVGEHQDATFLVTEPVSVTGFWFALEDATVENGCLWAIPGAHEGPVRERFGYEGDALVTQRLSDEAYAGEAVPLEAKAGTLVVLHGLLPHRSGANTSDRSRHAYAVHAVDGTAHWRADNWIRRGADNPARGFEVEAA